MQFPFIPATDLPDGVRDKRTCNHGEVRYEWRPHCATDAGPIAATAAALSQPRAGLGRTLQRRSRP